MTRIYRETVEKRLREEGTVGKGTERGGKGLHEKVSKKEY